MLRTHLTLVIPPAPDQNPQAKRPSFNSLPQSKTALREPLRMEPLATVPTLGGVPPLEQVLRSGERPGLYALSLELAASCRLPRPYSYLKATEGFTRVARRAGI